MCQNLLGTFGCCGQENLVVLVLDDSERLVLIRTEEHFSRCLLTSWSKEALEPLRVPFIEGATVVG